MIEYESGLALRIASEKFIGDAARARLYGTDQAAVADDDPPALDDRAPGRTGDDRLGYRFGRHRDDIRRAAGLKPV